MIDLPLILTILSMVFAMGVQTWLIIRYLMDRGDGKLEAERKERINAEVSMRTEISEFRDTHVRRDDFHRHIDNVEKIFANLTLNISNLSVALTGRLDSIMTMIATRSNDHANKN